MHRRLVAQAQEARRTVERDGRCRGYDPVDHAAREADIVFDPRGETAIDLGRELSDETLKGPAVARHVVAAEANHLVRPVGCDIAGLKAKLILPESANMRLGDRRSATNFDYV